MRDKCSVETFNDAIGLRVVNSTVDVVEANEMTDIGHELVLEMNALVTDDGTGYAVLAKEFIEEGNGRSLSAAIG